MARALFASAYSTPGRRAFGHLGDLPEDDESSVWARMDFGGCRVAAGVTTELVEFRVSLM